MKLEPDTISQIKSNYEIETDISKLFDEFLDFEPITTTLTILHPFIASIELHDFQVEVIFQNMPGAKSSFRRIIDFVMTTIVHFSFQKELLK